MKTYGTTLAKARLTTRELLVHLRDELLDGANYITAILEAPRPRRRTSKPRK